MIAFEFDEVEAFLKAIKVEKAQNLFYTPVMNMAEEKRPPAAEGQPPVSATVCSPFIALSCENRDGSRLMECVVKFDRKEIQSERDIEDTEDMLDSECHALKKLLEKFYPELGSYIKGRIKVYSE